MLAVATVDRQTLLEAAQEFSPHSIPSGVTNTELVAEKLKTDGGLMTTEPATCPNGEPYCNGPESDDLEGLCEATSSVSESLTHSAEGDTIVLLIRFAEIQKCRV